MNEAPPDIDEENDAEDARVAPARTPSARRRRHAFKVFRRRLGTRISAAIGAPAIRTITSSWRVTVAGEENLVTARAHGGGYFMALWHGRMLIPAASHGRQGYSVLVSPSGDGNVSEALLQSLGYGVVRGSTGKRSRSAVREMLRLLDAGSPIAITPDGPRGPPRAMTQSLAWMSNATGFPVVPCGFVAANAWHLRSWDRFTIPKPFSRVAFVYGEPHFVDRKAEGGLELATEAIRSSIDRAERRGFELLGVEPDG